MAEGASTAVAIVDQAAEQRRQAARTALVAGNTPRAIVPTDFEGAWRISQAVVAANMAPKSLETVEACAVAILHGLEVGLPPMMALQSIAVINGRPSLWGDGALGLIQGSGLLEDQDEHYEGQEGADTFKAICILKRRGRSRPFIGEFSVADAKKAGLFTKTGPWQAYLKRMLKMRARAFAMRDGFADVMKGLSVAEEQEDVVRAQTPDQHVDNGGGPPAPSNEPPVPNEETTSTEQVQEEAGPPMPEEDSADAGFPGDKPLTKPAADDLDIPDYLRRAPADTTAPMVPSERQWLAALDGHFSQAETMSDLAEAQEQHMTPYESSVSSETWTAASELLDHHVERLQKD